MVSCSSPIKSTNGVHLYFIRRLAASRAPIWHWQLARARRGLSHKIIFQNSPLKELLIRPLRVIEVGQIRQLLLGDGAYPSTDWLLKPFPNNIHLIETQKKINKVLFGGRVVVERAFGLLKGQWRYLLKRLYNENEYRKIPNIDPELIFGESCFMVGVFSGGPISEQA